MTSVAAAVAARTLTAMTETDPVALARHSAMLEIGTELLDINQNANSIIMSYIILIL